MFFVINRSITDWSLSLAAKNQIMFPKGKHKGLGPDQCRRKWSPELCFPLFTLELHLEHDYSPSRHFLLELLQNTLASSRVRPWIEDMSARPLMVRKVHIPSSPPARPWPRHCIIVVSTKFSIPQFWCFTVGYVRILWAWWCWIECRLIWRWGLIIVFNLDLLHFWRCYEQQVDD